MANVNLHVLFFLELALEDGVPDHSVLSRFRTKLTKTQAWDALLSEINRQIEGRNLMVKSGCHVDGSITHSPRKPKAKLTYAFVGDREERDDEVDVQADMRVVEVTQPGDGSEAR
jgi:IS5 family transposase